MNHQNGRIADAFICCSVGRRYNPNIDRISTEQFACAPHCFAEICGKRARRTRQLEHNPAIKARLRERLADVMPVDDAVPWRQVIVESSSMVVYVHMHQSITRNLDEAIPVLPERRV